MNIATADLQLLITTARESGLKRLRMVDGGVEFEFWDKPEAAPVSQTEKAAIGEETGMPTEDQLLFMSGIPLTDDEIRARAP